jgi:hypothetical protein
METHYLKEIQIKTLKNKKILGFQDYEFIKCKWRDVSQGFYRKNKSEWKPFIGLILNENITFKLGVLTHKIVDMNSTEETEKISCLLGGGKWLKQERGSFLNLEIEERNNIYYEINKFIDSPFLKFICQHKDNFYYFSKNKENRLYDYLESKDIIFEPLKDLEEINNLKKINEVRKLKYKDYSLLSYLSSKSDKKTLDLLEKVFVYHPEISLELNFYKINYNKNLILRYNLIYYYQKDDFKFKYLLYQEIKNLKTSILGKIKKEVWKQVRDYNLINRNVKEIKLEEIDLIDILLNMNVEYVVKVITLNPKLFNSKESKKYIKSKTTLTNHHISSHLLKLK